nr:unnamed protein product [Callosobruchus chinensis]CAH7754305.1 unnamed protein product [Callosobruchus chinensis]CAH7762103.1 unnamed protein product [Callosobruchus chinensis]
MSIRSQEVLLTVQPSHSI